MKNAFENGIKEILVLRWKPGKDILVVLLSWVLVVGAIYSSTNIIGREVWGGMGYFLAYAVLGALLFGMGIPIFWMVAVRKQPLSDLGITRDRLKTSLLLQILFSTILYIPAFRGISLPSYEQFIPLIFLSLAIGLFEAIFWRGWVQLRLEEAFGILPAILVGSFLYAAYHIGYGMPVSEMTFLFFIGIMYAVAFRLTRNILILYPFFQPMGQLITLIKDKLSLPLMASVGFGEVLIAMLALIWFASKYHHKQMQKVDLQPETNMQSVKL